MLLSFIQNRPTGMSYRALMNCRRKEDMDSREGVVYRFDWPPGLCGLFSRRDADFGYRYSTDCINCDTDWILPAIYQVLLLKHAAGRTMDADGFSIVDNRAGVTFSVELYVPWDAPEMAIDLTSSGTV